MNSWTRKRVCVLGAGNAGLFAALILKLEKPGLDVFVVGSSEIGIVGVGESSTEHINYFQNLIKATHKDVIQNAGATFKYGVYFDNWIGKDYVHSLVSQDANPNELFMYTNMAHGVEPLELTLPSNLKWEVNETDDLPNQFHFDTQKLNKWLVSLCEKHGVSLYDDKIELVNKDADGVISIESMTAVYEADLFVDATGFRRLLAKEFDEFEFVSKQDELFVDSAFAFPCEHEGDNYSCFTTAIKMDAGWMWRIPTSGRMGNGYCYSSRHLSYEGAIKEVTDKLGFKPNVAKTFKFDAGHYNKTWHKNVVLIGLSSHFFEPLEATAIGVGIQQARLLAKYINAEDMHDAYNDVIQDIMMQVFAFVRLHYVNCEQTTEFWEDVSRSLLPEKVKKYIDIAQKRVLLCEDIGNVEWRIFGAHNWNQVLYALNLLPQQGLIDHVSAYNQIPRKREFEVKDTLPHKQLIENWLNENSTNN